LRKFIPLGGRYKTMTNSTFTWAVVGAGPAGIAAVGKLMDHGISPKEIAWIDPAFMVGDFGTKWCKVSSNTRVRLFSKFYEACRAFDYASAPEFDIQKTDPNTTCLLGLAAEPLRWITQQLQTKVQVFQSKAQQLKLRDRYWEISLSDIYPSPLKFWGCSQPDSSSSHRIDYAPGTHQVDAYPAPSNPMGIKVRAKNVILATGAEPHSLSFPDVEEIHLSTALDPDKLNAACDKEDTIAVFGSSHSAIIILENLIEKTNVKKVINFYLAPLRYAVYFEDWILFDDTGLKGNAAIWARKHIDGKLPDKLQRVISDEENIRVTLPMCNKVVYATGFQKRLVPVEGMRRLEYNAGSGIIAPGLFGFGIAFPEAKMDRFGTIEHRVGLWKFMEYINSVMPVWLQYGT